MPYLPPTARLTNPTHRVVGPDGETEYFLIRVKGSTTRIRILFETPDAPAGSVSEGWGPSAAGAIEGGRWPSVIIHHFGGFTLDMLPEGSHLREIVGADRPSLYDFQTAILYRGWSDDQRRYPEVALSRATGNTSARLPVTRPEIAKARVAVEAHLAALLDGSFRRADGPMVLNTAPKVPGVAYYPTYVQAEGTPVPAEILPGFVSDARGFLAYLDFLEGICPMPERPRTRPATEQEIRDARQFASWTFKPEPLRAYARQVVETGMIDVVAADAAERERIRLANIETENLRAARAA